MPRLTGHVTSRLRTRARAYLGLTLGLFVALASLLPPAETARAEAVPGDPETVARNWVEALNRGDTTWAIDLYAEDAVVLALGKEIRGKPAIAQRQQGTIGPILRPKLTVESLTVQGDTVSLRLLGENAITRFDRRGPVHNSMTFTVEAGKIVREVRPVLDPADADWYAKAAPRFQQSQGTPATLPRAGGSGNLTTWLALLGVALLAGGLALRSLRSGAR